MRVTGRRITMRDGDVLVYKGLELDQDVLEAVTGTDRRLLWAFIKGDGGDVRAVPFTEEECVWLTESDLHDERDIEV
jgi:hypothetical protein